MRDGARESSRVHRLFIIRPRTAARGRLRGVVIIAETRDTGEARDAVRKRAGITR